jgi:Holliday junction resolvase RusA-like endonuclease
MLTLTIRKRLESQNRRDAWHWARRSKDRDDWQSRIVVQLYSCGGHAYLSPKVKRRVTITSYRSRLCDLANIVGGAKGLVDALTRSRLLVDDSPQWFECEYRQFLKKESPVRGERGAGEECTVITLEDCTAAT